MRSVSGWANATVTRPLGLGVGLLELSLLVLGLVVLSGCAGTTAPKGWLSTPAQAESLAYGGWIRVETTKTSYEGELLAVHGDSVFVLGKDGAFEAVALVDVARGRLTAYDPKIGTIALWSTVGTLSTASHGYVLIISAPVWILTGSLSATSTSRKGKVDYPKRSWHELAGYARFPQGLPAAVRETRALRAKPWREPPW